MRLFSASQYFGAIWCTGGDLFLQLFAFHQSGFDEITKKLLSEDKLVFGGFSAGVMITSTDFGVYDKNVDLHNARDIYRVEPIFEGLNLISEDILPYFGDLENDALSAERQKNLENLGCEFITLNDNNAHIISSGKAK